MSSTAHKQTIFRLLLLFILSFVVQQAHAHPLPQSHPPEHDKKVILYYPDWRGGVDISAYADRLTHLQYAFIDLEADGSCPPAGSQPTIDHLQELQADYPHLKVLLSIGGWTWSDNFPAVAADPVKRATMVDSCLALSRSYGFDGIDLDWEHPVVGGEPDTPGSPADVQNYVTLLEEIRAEMVGDEELSIAIGAAPSIYNPFDLAALAAPLDNVNIMTYDMSGGWSPNTYHHTPLYDNPLDSQNNNSAKNVDAFLAGGVPAEKIVMGVAFYGRGWQDVPDGGTNGIGQSNGDAIEMSYDQILGMIGNNGFVRYWDDLAKAPYLYNGDTWIGYDDAESICEKAKFALERDIGGLMAWEITQNLSNDDLIGAIDTCLIDPNATPMPTATDAPPTATPVTPTPDPLATDTPTPEPVATSVPPPAGSLVPNGDFSLGSSNWYNVGATADTATGAACITLDTPAQNPWDVLLGSLGGRLIENGNEYRLTFTAWATEETQINAVVALGEAPWTTYLLQAVPVSIEPQMYEYDFTMTEPTDPNAAFAFQFGDQPAETVCVDDVALVRTAIAQPTAVPTVAPTPTPIPAGQQCNIMMHDWYGGASGAMSFTFDDGYMSQYTYAQPILAASNVPATFFITSNVLAFDPYMSWDEVNALAAAGHEIGAHTVTHPNLTNMDEGDESTSGTIRWELEEANQAIEANVPSSAPIISFAYPFAAHNTPVREITMEYYEAARSVSGANFFNDVTTNYSRGRQSASSASFFNDVLSPDWSQLDSYEPNFANVRTAADEADELVIAQNWIDELVARGTWGITDIHSVVPFSMVSTDGSWQPVASEWFEEWVEYTVAADLWVDTMGNVTRYAKARDASVCLMDDSAADQIMYTFTDNLDDTIFNHPLSVMMPLPAGWDAAVTQDGITVSHQIIVENGESWIMANIVPDGGDVMVANGGTSPLAVELQTETNGSIPFVWTALFAVTTVLLFVTVVRRFSR